MKSNHSRLVRIMVAGMLAALPLVATAALVFFSIGLVVKWLGPGSMMGQILRALGVGVSGHEWTGYVVGLGLVALLIFALGVLVEKGLAAWLNTTVNTVVGRIPVVRTVYETIRKFVEVVSQRDENQLQTMRPVWCHFGGPGGVSALALLSSPEPVLVNGFPCYALIVPTAPVPIGGGLLYVPVDWISPADVGMEALTSIYVSMGVTSPQFLPLAPAAPRQQPSA
ncbi:MAG: DUF502 domain-containing protein [Lysobacter sp.]|nr:DUF502 domain-containing protein [Lysobacter sp.]